MFPMPLHCVIIAAGGVVGDSHSSAAESMMNAERQIKCAATSPRIIVPLDVRKHAGDGPKRLAAKREAMSRKKIATATPATGQ